MASIFIIPAFVPRANWAFHAKTRFVGETRSLRQSAPAYLRTLMEKGVEFFLILRPVIRDAQKAAEMANEMRWRPWGVERPSRCAAIKVLICQPQRWKNKSRLIEREISEKIKQKGYHIINYGWTKMKCWFYGSTWETKAGYRKNVAGIDWT